MKSYKLVAMLERAIYNIYFYPYMHGIFRKSRAFFKMKIISYLIKAIIISRILVIKLSRKCDSDIR